MNNNSKLFVVLTALVLGASGAQAAYADLVDADYPGVDSADIEVAWCTMGTDCFLYWEGNADPTEDFEGIEADDTLYFFDTDDAVVEGGWQIQQGFIVVNGADAGMYIDDGDDAEGDDVTDEQLDDVVDADDDFQFVVRYVDDDGEGDFDFDEGEENLLFVDVDDDNEVTAGDIDLSNGNRVTNSHDLAGVALEDFDGNDLSFFDEDDDGEFDAGESLIADADNSGGASIGDVMITEDMGAIIDSDFGFLDEVASEESDGELAFADLDQNGEWDAGEPSVLALDEDGDDELDAETIVLSGDNQGEAGASVEGEEFVLFSTIATDGEINGDVLCFVDDDGEGFSEEDLVVLAFDCTGTLAVEDFDLFEGRKVTSGSYDIGSALEPLGGWTFRDTDGDLEESDGDEYFLSLVAGDVSVDDRRVSGANFGDHVPEGSGLLDFTPESLDDQDDGTLDNWFCFATEDDDIANAVYLAPAGSTEVAENNFRIAGEDAGTLVGIGDDDEEDELDGGALLLDAAGFAFLDATGNGLSDDDSWFFDTDGDLEVGVGDFSLPDGDRIVQGGDDFGAELELGLGCDENTITAGEYVDIQWVDFDDEDDLDEEENIYLVQANGALTTNDFILFEGSPFQDDGGVSPPDDEEPPVTTPPDDGNETPPVTPPVDPDPKDDDPKDETDPTPGFELVALVAALGVALILVRRKA
jgi:hypothetical protein